MTAEKVGAVLKSYRFLLGRSAPFESITRWKSPRGPSATAVCRQKLPHTMLRGDFPNGKWRSGTASVPRESDPRH